jgi:hypothetical protein
VPFLLPTADEIPVAVRWIVRRLGPLAHRAYHTYTVAYCARRIAEYAPAFALMRTAAQQRAVPLTGTPVAGAGDPRRARLEREAAEREVLGRAALSILFATAPLDTPPHGYDGGALSKPNAIDPE